MLVKQALYQWLSHQHWLYIFLILRYKSFSFWCIIYKYYLRDFIFGIKSKKSITSHWFNKWNIISEINAWPCTSIPIFPPYFQLFHSGLWLTADFVLRCEVPSLYLHLPANGGAEGQPVSDCWFGSRCEVPSLLTLSALCHVWHSAIFRLVFSFSYCLILRIDCGFWIQILHQINALQVFSTNLCLICFANSAFHGVKISTFHSIRFTNFSFIDYASGGI